MNHDVWPVVFVAYRSKAEEVLAALREGSLTAGATSKMHARRGARFVLLVEDGRFLAAGEVVKAVDNQYELSVSAEVREIAGAPELTGERAEKFKALLAGEKRGRPVVAFVLPTAKNHLPVNTAWFDEVTELAIASLSHAGTSGAGERSTKPESGPASPSNDADRELLEWIPPKLAALVTGRARADEWERVVCAAFRALGLATEELGQTRAGESVPDCTATYVGREAGEYTLVVDAKAGIWNAPKDALRAMKEYVKEYGGINGRPVFVVGALGSDAKRELDAFIMCQHPAVAITGRQLGELLMKKLRDPHLPFENELRLLLASKP